MIVRSFGRFAQSLVVVIRAEGQRKRIPYLHQLSGTTSRKPSRKLPYFSIDRPLFRREFLWSLFAKTGSRCLPSAAFSTNSTQIGIKYRRKLPQGFLRTMEIRADLLEKILSPEILVLKGIFDKYGYELRMAGGAVRDLLCGKIPADIDFATTATPDEMKAMFEAESIRLINAKGEKHGTITPRINEKENFEVTTLRIDVVTDGRHAEVEFTKNWELDAARRDLTINSMFMDLDGKVYDYFNGAEDLKNDKVRFVGDPVQRIQEDYLRILRYFRFYGRISPVTENHETATLEAIRNNMKGLEQISGERLWMELKKILVGNYVEELVTKMLELGIAQYIGLPSDCNVQEFVTVSERLKSLALPYNAITVLTALLRDEQQAIDLNKRLKLSAYERDLCLFIILYRNTVGKDPSSIKSFQKIVIFSKSKQSDVKRWVEEIYMYNGSLELLKEFQEWSPPKFPVSGHVLVERKVPGRTMNRVLMDMKEIWIDSNFTITADELLAQLPQILEQVSTKFKSK